MVGNRNDYFIAGMKLLQSVAVCNNIERFGRILGKHHLAGIVGTDKTAYRSAGGFNQCGGFHRKGMGAAPCVSVAAGVVRLYAVEHCLRTLRGCGSIQIVNIPILQ